jgi:manganese/zinc/iron transport system permease protein
MGLKSINSAAMMAVVSGAFLILAILLGWRSGVITQFFRQRSIAMQILQDDILALMYRRSEIAQGNRQETSLSLAVIANELKTPLSKLRAIVGRMMRHDLARITGGQLMLTDTGRRTAQNLIRSHRLWEQYLSVETNLPESKVHPHAESWEHFTSPSMRGELDALTGKSTTDPHGRTIPPEG